MSRAVLSIRRLLPLLPAAGVALAWAAFAPLALAHGDDVPEPTFLNVLTAWSFDPTLQLPIALSALAYVWAYRHVNAAHSGNPVPRRRLAYWFAGLVAVEIALQSPIDRYEGVLFTVHMVQHIVLIFGAAPLLVLAEPITLLLRVARAEQRKRLILPVLHSRLLRLVSFPVVAWLLFAGTMWGTHFSPMFNLALENDYVHDLEHLLYISTAMLFWWPVAGVDPSPWRMPHAARLGYVFLQMPQNSFLGLAIYSATTTLYSHYATVARDWGPTPLADQQLAGGIMWVAGDLLFLGVVLLVVADWARHEEREAKLADARDDAALAAIRAREIRLEQRLASEREAADGSEAGSAT